MTDCSACFWESEGSCLWSLKDGNVEPVRALAAALPVIPQWVTDEALAVDVSSGVYQSCLAWRKKDEEDGLCEDGFGAVENDSQ